MASLNLLFKHLNFNQRLRVTVWHVEDEEQEFSFDSFVLRVEDMRFLIKAPPSDQKEVLKHMETGVVLGVVVECFPNPLIVYPVVHSHERDRGVWLQIPDNCQVEVVQRRRHVRIPMQIPIKVEYQFSQDNWLTLDATTEDMSGGGLRFTSSRKFFKDQELLLHIRFREGDPELRLKAKVILAGESKARKHDNDFFYASCQFIDIPEAEETVIMRECFKRELAMKRNKL